MFGPNTYFTDSVDIHFSHRDEEFFNIFQKVTDLFTEKFQLYDYDVLFIPGSGTIGIESTFFSMDYKLKFIGNDGAFKDRLVALYSNYAHLHNKGANKAEMFVRLETSISKPFYKEGCLMDCISAFPYYPIPQDTKLFVTCLNKQIGSYVGLSVVCVKRSEWKHCIDETVFSYLNLRRYYSYLLHRQTPHTTPTFIYEHLHKVLKDFNLDAHVEKINKVSELICKHVPDEFIIGDRYCPVITIKKEAFSDRIAQQYDLYGYWTGKPVYQFFTYAQPYQDYVDFFNSIS